ncbi:MAG: hypothetical protein AAFR87_03705 [Bacteroidota bacterium]
MNEPQRKAMDLVSYLTERKDFDAISKEQITDAYELIIHYEWGIAVENLMEVLYEQDFIWDEKGLRIARDAWQAAGLDGHTWKSFIITES